MHSTSDEKRIGIHILSENTDYAIARADHLLASMVDRPAQSHQWTVTFENGYSASIITGPGAFCSNEEPYELAVIHDGSLCFMSPVTDDVLGYLDDLRLNYYLDAIAQLPRKDDCTHARNSLS